MRIAVTGQAGQLVCALAERAGAHEVIALGRPLLDLARPETIAPALAAARPDVVINAAAYTAVDKAEAEEDLAFAINATGAGEVARAAHALGAGLIHVSTDYVFDGSKPAPYVETDAPAPTGAYGRSKLAGEQAVLAAHPQAVVARTAWVYSPFGANFVKTMLRLAQTREELGVVADQFGCPTNALDLADALLAIAPQLGGGAPQVWGNGGVFHLAGTGEASWAEFASAIFAASAELGGPAARVKPITTADYPTPARRPANSRLDCSAAKAAFGVALPAWQGAVRAVVHRLIREQGQ